MFEQAKQTLSDILHPYSYDQFFDEIVGKRPLAIKNAGDRGGMLGADPKQTILDAFETYAPTLTCHSDAPTLPPPKPRAVSGPDEFLHLVHEYHAKNYTVRIPAVSNLTPALKTFIRALETLMGKPADVVIFWSQAGLAAPIHHDNSDIICIQLAGKKKWFVSSDPPSLANDWNRIGEARATMPRFDTLDVAPGDLLYLPRGTNHTVQSPTESIHLSIGFTPVTLRDAVIATLDHFSDFQLPLRAGVLPRADAITQGENIGDITRQVQEALQRLTEISGSEDFVKDALDLRQARMVVDLPKLEASTPAKPLSPQSRVRHNVDAIAHLSLTPDHVDFAQPGHHILIHRGAEDSIQFMAETPEFTISDIPGAVSDDVRIALTERLLSCGFLVVIEET